MPFWADEPDDLCGEPVDKGYRKFHTARNTLYTFVGN